MNDETMAEIRREWQEALPRLAAGEPDRTDLMVSDKLAEPKIFSHEEIAMAACRAAGLTLDQLVERNNYGKGTKARMVAMLVMSRLSLRRNVTSIGRSMERDHSTAREALRSVRAKLERGDVQTITLLHGLLSELQVSRAEWEAAG